MKFLIICELIALFISPFLMAILKRRGAILDKHMAFIVATLLGLLPGSYFLYLRNATTAFSLTLKDWLIAIGLALSSWIIAYSSYRWLQKQ